MKRPLQSTPRYREGTVPAALLVVTCEHAKVLAQFRKEVRRRRVGYQTLINEVLAEHVRKNVA
jgi:hypothetical protein